MKFECFSTGFSMIFKYQILWKSVYWGPSCVRRTDNRRDEAACRLSQFYDST